MLHGLFVGFVVFSLPLVLAGGLWSWRWVRNRCFRLSHLLAIALVAAQAWLGVPCPLTTWEMALRSRAGRSVYTETFIGHWLQEILFYQAPDWVFISAYTVFAGLVALAWALVRPRGRNRPGS